MTDKVTTKSWTEWMVSSNDSLVAAASAYPHVRGGLPCLRDTRFTLGQMLAELCDTPGPDIVAARFDFNPGFIREALNGLALFLEDKPRMNDLPERTDYTVRGPDYFAGIAAERERCERIAAAELEAYAEEGGEIWVVRHILDKIRSGGAQT